MTAAAVDASLTVDVVVSTTEEGPISAPMVAALENAWAATRARHPEVPAVVVVLGAGSISAGGLKLGTSRRCAGPTPTSPLPRTSPAPECGCRRCSWAGEGLAREPAEALGTLLHDAAHALAHVRGIKDTSRQGRWHNARFKAIAEELGIEVTKDGRMGWSPTTIPAATRDAYTEVIAGRVLRLHSRGRDDRPRLDEEADPARVRVRVRSPHPCLPDRTRRWPDHLRGLRHRTSPPTTAPAAARQTPATTTRMSVDDHQRICRYRPRRVPRPPGPGPKVPTAGPR